MADLIDRDLTIHELEAFRESCIANLLRMSFDDITDVVKEIPSVNRWIPCSERLPDAFIYVICAGEEGMAILRYNGEVWVDDAGCIYPMSAITHWMPLPELPEKE